jgi:hypothetical protein
VNQFVNDETRLEWARIEAFARRLISQYPVEPYVTLADMALFKSFRDQLFGSGSYLTSPEDIPALKDSASAPYLDALQSHPNSPYVLLLLRHGYLSEIKGDHAHEKLLAELVRDHPGTRAALEAARQLAESGWPSGIKK